MRIALIGCGAIGRVIAEAVTGGMVTATLECIYDVNPENSRRLAESLSPAPKLCRSFDEVLTSGASLVVEAASQEAVRSYALEILRAGKNLMLMSVGALMDEDLLDSMKKAARENNVKIYIPSGAVGGLDALKAASIGKVDEVKLITTKHPRGLKDAPYLRRRGGLDWEEKMILYMGNSKDAVKKFPANINVSATLALSGVGPKKTMVEIVSDPEVDVNIHEVFVKGDFGSFRMMFKNLPSPDNPKTSYLAALSAIAMLKRITSPLEVGT